MLDKFLWYQVFLIFFFILFVFMPLLITFQNLLFKKDLFCLLTKQTVLSATWILIIKKNILMYYVKGVLQGRIFMETICILKHAILAVFFWKTIFENQYVWYFAVIFFIFLSRWINWNKSELIHLNKNMKTKENCFKNVNDKKWSLTKNRKTLQVMYVRDFWVSILACKDYKINTKTLKILVFHVILFFSVSRSLGLFTLCSLAANFLSLANLFFYLIYKHWNE